jgi:hypothetical protein
LTNCMFSKSFCSPFCSQFSLFIWLKAARKTHATTLKSPLPDESLSSLNSISHRSLRAWSKCKQELCHNVIWVASSSIPNRVLAPISSLMSTVCILFTFSLPWFLPMAENFGACANTRF